MDEKDIKSEKLWDWREPEEDNSHSEATPPPPFVGGPPVPPAYHPFGGGAPGYQTPYPQQQWPVQPPYGNQQSYPAYPTANPNWTYTDYNNPAAPKPLQYFFVESELNSMVLDISAANTAPGSQVITWPRKKADNANQLWYEDVDTTTIRSKLHGMCLEITGGGVLVVRPFEPANNNQRLRFADGVVHVCCHPGSVLDIAAAAKREGAKVVCYKHHGGPNQKWKWKAESEGETNWMNSREHPNRRCFFIRSDLNHKVLDIAGNKRDKGTPVIMFPRKSTPCSNQMWYADQNGIVRSTLNDFALDSSGGDLTMQPYKPNQKHQQWKMRGRQLVNAHYPKEVLDVKGNNMADGARIIMFKDHGMANQQWMIDYV